MLAAVAVLACANWAHVALRQSLSILLTHVMIVTESLLIPGGSLGVQNALK